MARKFLTPIDLTGLELLNARIQNLATPPAHSEGRIYYDTALDQIGVSDGAAWTYLAAGSSITTEDIQDIVGAMVDTNTETGITVTYDDTSGKLNFVVAAPAAASETAAGIVELATAAETTTGTDTTRAVHPAGLKVELDKKITGFADPNADRIVFWDDSAGAYAALTPSTGLTITTTNITVNTASETAQGIVELATAAETTTGTDNTRAVHPAGLKVELDKKVNTTTVASETVSGIVELATAAETTTGTDTTRAVHPAGLKVELDKKQNTSSLASTVQAYTLNQFAAPTASVAFNNQKITGLADPTSAQEAATKAYVDAVAQGLNVKDSVRLATTAANGNQTLTGAATIDGVAVATNDRILVKNQTTGSQNGVYIANTAGAWTRATDWDSAGDVAGGTFVFVEAGTLYADTGWVVTNDGTVTVGTTAVTFAQFSGAGSFTAGAGMTQTGTTFDIATGAGSGITVAADAISVDTAVVVRKYAATIGGATTATVSHNLGTQDITYSIREVTGNAFVDADAVSTDANTLTLTFAVAPAASSLRVVVHG